MDSGSNHYTQFSKHSGGSSGVGPQMVLRALKSTTTIITLKQLTWWSTVLQTLNRDNQLYVIRIKKTAQLFLQQ
jgi:hypothetical protein